MTKTLKNTMLARFQEIALVHFQDRKWTVDEMYEVCVAQGLWPDLDPSAVEMQRKRELRRWCRVKIKDEDGNTREIVNINRPFQTTDPEGKQQFFAFTDVLDQDDFEWLIRDRIKKSNYFASEARHFLEVFQERFGKRARNALQRRLQLKFD